MDELIFDSKTGKVMTKTDYDASQPVKKTMGEKISDLHKNGHYSGRREKINRSLKETIKNGKAKYRYKPIFAIYGVSIIVMKFKNIKACGKYFNVSKNSIRYHLVNKTMTKNGWYISFT